MKIIYLVSSFQQSGPGNVVRYLANGLVKQNQRVRIISLSDDFPKYTNLDKRVECEMLSGSHGSVTAAMVTAIQQTVDVLKPDVIHSHGIRADVVNTKLQTNATKVSTSHNNPFVDYPQAYGIKGLVMALYQIRIFRQLDGIATLTPSLRKSISWMVGNNKTFLIPNGVPMALEQNRKTTYAPTTRIGIVASLIPRKRVGSILKAFSTMKLAHVSLEIFGDGPLLDKFKSEYKNNVAIHFHGFEKDTQRIFSSIDVFLSMSVSEGLPLAVLEAINNDVPVVLSSIASHKYICNQLPAGSYALVNPFTSGPLKSIFLKINENALKFSDYGRTFKEKFSDEVMTSNYLKMYVELRKDE